MSIRHSGILGGFLGTLLVSCVDDPDELAVLRGPLVDYRHSHDLSPCAGNIDETNNFVASLADAMRRPVGDLPHLSFSWVTPEGLAALTDGCTDSCAVGKDAFSVRPIINHELAHALYHGVSSRPASVLSEGFATAMDILHYTNHEIVESRDPRVLFGKSELTTDLYSEAGLFVIYLIQSFGPEKFQALYAHLSDDSSQSDWEEAFQAIYGSTLDVIVEGYLAATDCPEDVAPFPPYGCDAPLLPSQDGAWHYYRTLRCADPDVFGGIDDLGGFATTVTLDVEIEGEYDVALVSPTDVKSLVSIGACDSCRWLPKAIVLGQGQVRRAPFLAGRHVLTIRLFEGDSHDFHVSVTPAP